MSNETGFTEGFTKHSFKFLVKSEGGKGQV